MRYTAKDAEEFAKLAAAAAKRKQPVPEYCVPRPELRSDLLFWFTAYCELQTVDFAPSEVHWYAQNYNVPPELMRYIMSQMWRNKNGDPRSNRT